MLRRNFIKAAIGAVAAMFAGKAAKADAAEVFHDFEIEVNGTVFTLTILGPANACSFGISIPCRIKALGSQPITRTDYRILTDRE